MYLQKAKRGLTETTYFDITDFDCCMVKLGNENILEEEIARAISWRRRLSSF